jgi:hypothetical protein
MDGYFSLFGVGVEYGMCWSLCYESIRFSIWMWDMREFDRICRKNSVQRVSFRIYHVSISFFNPSCIAFRSCSRRETTSSSLVIRHSISRQSISSSTHTFTIQGIPGTKCSGSNPWRLKSTTPYFSVPDTGIICQLFRRPCCSPAAPLSTPL